MNKVKNILALIVIIGCIYFIYSDIQKKKVMQTRSNIPAVEQKEIRPISVEIRKRKTPNLIQLSEEDKYPITKKFGDDFENCTKYSQTKEFQKADICFGLLEKNYYNYDFYQNNINSITYSRGLIKKELGQYKEAKTFFEEVIYYEKNNENLVQDAKSMSNYMDELAAE